jgi:flagellar motor component MotA
MKKILAIVIIGIFAMFSLIIMGLFIYELFVAYHLSPQKTLLVIGGTIGGLLVAVGIGALLYWCEKQLKK